MALAAISAGVTGTAGFLSGGGAEPVTAQEMMVDGEGLIDRKAPGRDSVDGAAVAGSRGDTVASALLGRGRARGPAA